MRSQLQSRTKAIPAVARTPRSIFTPVTQGVQQRACACEGSGSGGGECEECKKRETLQRSASGFGGAATAPPIVHEVLRSPGQPLDVATRRFFEPRFGYDFSKVRVHTDARAAESAHAVNAFAYTAGCDVVFGRGQYSPSTHAGQKLIAHELAHVLQQDFRDARNHQVKELGPTGDKYERDADQAASSVSETDSARRSPVPAIQGSALPLQPGPAIQRQAMNCITSWVEDECKNATAKCASAADYCKTKFPKPGDLDAYRENLKNHFAESDFGPNAKTNFAHWLDGSGTELVMPTALFVGHKATNATLMTHREKFLEGVRKRLDDGRITPGKLSDVIPYTGHGNAFSLFPPSPHSDDLAWSVGGFQLCSNVRVMTTKTAPNRYKVKFVEWKCQAFDCYNWDPGKGVGLPGLDDQTLCCVENAGKAKHFLDHTAPWDNKDPNSTADADV